MSGFFYFLPGAKGQLTKEKLKQYGLEHIADLRDYIERRPIMTGPENRSGIICANRKNYAAEEVKWYDGMFWRKMPATDSEKQAWVGLRDKDDLPAPDDLARDKLLPGGMYMDAFARSWQIPCARSVTLDPFEIKNKLPTTLDIGDDDGEYYHGEVVRRYRPLWESVIKYWDAIYGSSLDPADEDGERALEYDVKEQYLLVTNAFSANYRVGRRELQIMELLTEDGFFDIARIVIDTSGMATLKKNLVPDTGTTSDGEPQSKQDATAPDTTQPVPTS